MNAKACLILSLVCIATLRVHADPVILDQPYTVGAFNTWESYTAPGGPGGRTYDDFSLAATSAVTAVKWHGDYIDTATDGANPSAPNTEAFEISFWSDKNGQPGTVLTTESVPLADAAPTSLGTIGFSFRTGDRQIPFYSYRAVLPTPFVAAAGQKYWVSISSRSTSNQPTWSWYSGSGGDQKVVQDFQGQRYARDLDRSLVLEGVPATIAQPVVSVAATAKTAHVAGGVPAVFTLSFATPPTSKVVVRYTLSGSAVNGQDYAKVKGAAKFKPGQESVEVPIQPQGDLGGGTKKTVKLTLNQSGAYIIGGKSSAKAKIVNP